MSIPAQERELRVSPAAAFSILLIIIGTIGMTVGLTMHLGWFAAFLTPGTIALTIGVALGFRT